MTYSFIAQQYGTTWYHSHFTAQYGNGVIGSVCLAVNESRRLFMKKDNTNLSHRCYLMARHLCRMTLTWGSFLSSTIITKRPTKLLC
jgi:hypothetical protein